MHIHMPSVLPAWARCLPQVCSELLTLQPNVPAGMTSTAATGCRQKSARYLMLTRTTASQPSSLRYGLPISQAGTSAWGCDHTSRGIWPSRPGNRVHCALVVLA